MLQGLENIEKSRPWMLISILAWSSGVILQLSILIIVYFQPYTQYYSRAVSPYGTFIVCTDRPVQAAWQQYRPIVTVSSAETASYKPRRV